MVEPLVTDIRELRSAMELVFAAIEDGSGPAVGLDADYLGCSIRGGIST